MESKSTLKPVRVAVLVGYLVLVFGSAIWAIAYQMTHERRRKRYLAEAARREAARPGAAPLA